MKWIEEVLIMRKQSIIFIICVLLLAFVSPVVTVEAKAKPKLSVKAKTMTVGESYKLRLKKVSSGAKVKWKTSKKSVVTIAKKKGNTVTLKAKKKGTAVITAKYKKKTYQCKITVKDKKPTVDNPVLNSRDVTLYHLSDLDEKEFPYDKNHLREYRFRVSGTKKEVRKWELVGEDADYFTITAYGLVKTQWGPAYVAPCVTATVVATLEDGRTLKATVRAYSELNIYIDSVFDSFEKQYITANMTQKEKVEKAAWYIGATSDYQAQDSEWYHIFTLHQGDCSASRYALMYMCRHMGIKAVACRDIDYHGQTLVKADGIFYMVVTGYNEPKPRQYTIYEMSDKGVKELAEDNGIDLKYFD